jgi:peptide/nickel transport system permease protein
VIANIRALYHLDQPVPNQYVLWVTGVLRGDFGQGYQYKQSVTSLIRSRLPVTLGLVAIAFCIMLVASIPLGVLSAIRRNTWLDRILSVISLILVSAPLYLICILMIMIIARIAPAVAFTGSFSNFSEFLQRMLLPSLALSFSMISQLQSHYALTAVYKGLPYRMVVFKHAFKNAIIPVITIISIQVGTMIVGAVLVENVFSLPGLGSLLIDSIKASDYPIVQGITLLLVSVFLIISMLVDIVYALIDPKIRLN